MSTRAWGYFFRTAGAGFAVPMFKPLYTWEESTLINPRENSLASEMARSVFPTAVGPIRKIIGDLAIIDISQCATAWLAPSLFFWG
jgi:hypothetical protein